MNKKNKKRGDCFGWSEWIQYFERSIAVEAIPEKRRGIMIIKWKLKRKDTTQTDVATINPMPMTIC